MPDTGASRKRQIARRRIPGDLAAQARPAAGLYRARLSRRSLMREPSRRPVDCCWCGLDHAPVLFVQHPSGNSRSTPVGALPLYCLGGDLR
jgi:hypothetical protein